MSHSLAKDPSPAPAEAGVRPALRFDSIEVVYERNGETNRVLDAVTLEIRAGELAAIVGPSGCGKTTLLHLAAGLSSPNQGSVTLGGQSIRSQKTRIGVAFQNPVLMPWRSTLENVLLPMELVEPYKSASKSERVAWKEKALHLLDAVGLKDYASYPPTQLSGGMRQRASLCRALIHDPGVLLLDEPFGALDAFTREEMWNLLERLRADFQCSTLLVTHDLREAVYLGDKVYVMGKHTPGGFVHTLNVELPRPRDPEVAFTPEYNDYVHSLIPWIKH